MIINAQSICPQEKRYHQNKITDFDSRSVAISEIKNNIKIKSVFMFLGISSVLVH